MEGNNPKFSVSPNASPTCNQPCVCNRFSHLCKRQILRGGDGALDTLDDDDEWPAVPPRPPPSIVDPDSAEEQGGFDLSAFIDRAGPGAGSGGGEDIPGLGDSGDGGDASEDGGADGDSGNALRPRSSDGRSALGGAAAAPGGRRPSGADRYGPRVPLAAARRAGRWSRGAERD